MPLHDFEKPSETTYDPHPLEINVRRFMNFIEFLDPAPHGMSKCKCVLYKYKTAQTADSIHVEKQGLKKNQ